MKKILLCFLLLLMPTLALAQSEQQYYMYNIVSFEGDLNREDVRIWVDNGQTVERLRDENGRRIKFKTPAVALMYFLSKGWTLYQSGETNSGSCKEGTGSNESTTYWIIRKPCTKEEFEKVVEQGKENSLL